MPIEQLLAALSDYGFLDPLGHPLAGCAEFQELARRAADSQAQPVALSDERINHIADLVLKGMPDGVLGFCAKWGYRQFARALLDDCAGHYAISAVDKAERRAITSSDLMTRHLIAMQAAVIDAQLVSPEEGMQWIANTLFGPGLLPDIEAARAMGGAQAWFDAKVAEHEAFRAAHPGPAERAA